MSDKEWVQELYGHYYRQVGNGIEVAVLDAGLECVKTTTLSVDDLASITSVDESSKLSGVTSLLVAQDLDSAHWNGYDSAEDGESLNTVIQKLGLPPLLHIPDGEISNEWSEYCFPNCDPISVVLGRRKDEEIFESIQFSAYDNKAFVHYNTARLGTVNDRADYFLEFVKDLERNPSSYIEAQAYESTTHGASGMDKNHYDLTSLQEINDVLASYEVAKDLFLKDDDVTGLLEQA